MINFLMLMRLMQQASFINSKAMTFDGKAVIDPSRRYYYGNSQGGIYGTTYVALSTDLTRGVLGVAGTSESIQGRSLAFNPRFAPPPFRRLPLLPAAAALARLWSTVFGA
jgi:hypothetical protein